MATWITDKDVNKAIRRIKREDQKVCKGCNVFYVPLPADAHYEINYYQPQVEGVQFLGNYNYKTGWDFSHLQNDKKQVEFGVNFIEATLDEQGALDTELEHIDSTLDELVHEVKSAEASSINNDGRQAQLGFLIDDGGYSTHELLDKLVPGWKKKEAS